MAGKHDVYVYQDGTYKVRPAVSFGSAGKAFSFRNLTNQLVNLTFPAGLMKEGTTQSIPAQTSTDFHILSTADGFYAYQVSVSLKGKKRRKAYGESDPGMIIDP